MTLLAKLPKLLSAPSGLSVPKHCKWTRKVSQLLGLSLAVPFNAEVISCTTQTLGMFRASAQLGLPHHTLDNGASAARVPTLLALYNVNDSSVHGLWIAEPGTCSSHSTSDQVRA